MEDADLLPGDKLTILRGDGTYREEEIPLGGSAVFNDDDIYMIKFVTLPSASIGAKQVAVEAKEKTIEDLTRRKENEIKPDKQKDYQEQIDKLNEEITLLFTAEDGLYALMNKAAGLADKLFQDHKIMEDGEAYQAEIEHEFTTAMGDMLKDGYWSNNNYALGQEEFLYQDALDMM